MNLLFTSLKGGVGCTSLSYLTALCMQYDEVYSSDPFLSSDAMLVKVHSTEEFEFIREPTNLIMDFTYAHDSALVENAIDLADVVIIPCQTDVNSVKLAIELYSYLTHKQKVCLIMINGFKGVGPLDKAKTQLKRAAISYNNILALKDTRLMDRLIANGPAWFTKVHNERGLHKLIGTIKEFEQILKHTLALKQRG